MADLIPFDGELDPVPATAASAVEPAAPVASAAPVAAAAPSPTATTPAAPVALKPFDGVLDPAPATAAVEPPKPERSVLGEIGHQVGLTARAAVQGAAALPGMVSDAATGLVNAGLDAYTDARAPTTSELVTGQKEKGFRFQKVSSALGNIMDQTGVAKPENATERVVQDAATGAATALTGVGAGQAVANAAAGPITKALGSAMAAAPGMQAVSGAAGAGASGLTRESGGGAVAQGVAGLAGALAPAAVLFAAQAGVRGALRGGEAGRQRVADNIATFEDATGTLPTVGQAVQTRGLQAAETGLSNVIGGNSIMVRKGEEQAAALAKSVQDLTDRLAPNASGADAGEAISRGVNAFKDNVKTVQQRLYSSLDQHIPAATPMGVGRTQAALESLNEGIPGAPNISNFFKNARIGSIERALGDDLELARKAQAPTGMSSTGATTLPGQLPYEAVQKLRSLVGREISENSLTSDVPRSKWRALYGALSDDLGDAAKAAGPQAEQAWARANQYTRTSIQRLDQLESIVSRDAPEKVFRAATSGLAEGGTVIRRLMRSLPVDNRREVGAAVLQRLGRAKNSAQDEMGSQFSSETFLTNLAALSPAARSALFGSLGVDGLPQKIQQLGRMAAVRRDGSAVFSNPSGTARQAGMIGWAAGLGTALASGNSAAITMALAAPLIANAAARTVTRPGLVRWMAKPTALSEAAAPATLAAIERAPAEPERPGLRRMREGRAARLSGTAMPAKQ